VHLETVAGAAHGGLVGEQTGGGDVDRVGGHGGPRTPRRGPSPPGPASRRTGAPPPGRPRWAVRTVRGPGRVAPPVRRRGPPCRAARRR
jgi:hypothetical protein